MRLLKVVAIAGKQLEVRPRFEASRRTSRRLLEIHAPGHYRCFLTAAWLGKPLDWQATSLDPRVLPKCLQTAAPADFA